MKDTKGTKPYQLKVVRENDSYIDFEILYGNDTVGILNINFTKSNQIFIRQIRIFEQYRKQHHATHTVDYLLCLYTKDVIFSIASQSQSAIDFWNNYMSKNKKRVKHLKGLTYQVSYL